MNINHSVTNLTVWKILLHFENIKWTNCDHHRKCIFKISLCWLAIVNGIDCNWDDRTYKFAHVCIRSKGIDKLMNDRLSECVSERRNQTVTVSFRGGHWFSSLPSSPIYDLLNLHLSSLAASVCERVNPRIYQHVSFSIPPGCVHLFLMPFFLMKLSPGNVICLLTVYIWKMRRTVSANKC